MSRETKDNFQKLLPSAASLSQGPLPTDSNSCSQSLNPRCLRHWAAKDLASQPSQPRSRPKKKGDTLAASERRIVLHRDLKQVMHIMQLGGECYGFMSPMEILTALPCPTPSPRNRSSKGVQPVWPKRLGDTWSSLI